MKQTITRVLRELFVRELAALPISFREQNEKSLYIAPGERVFSYFASDNVRLFIVVVPDRKGGGRFTIEIGWSKLGRFPHLSMRPSPDEPTACGEEFRLDEYMCRLGQLEKGGDKWWRLPTEFGSSATSSALVSEVEVVVLRAVQDIRAHGLPYLVRFVEFLGQSSGESGF